MLKDKKSSRASIISDSHMCEHVKGMEKEE